jgi:hypothetical protein
VIVAEYDGSFVSSIEMTNGALKLMTAFDPRNMVVTTKQNIDSFFLLKINIGSDLFCSQYSIINPFPFGLP